MVIVWREGVLANAKVVITLQYISFSHQHIVYLKLTQHYMPIISSNKAEKIFLKFKKFLVLLDYELF